MIILKVILLIVVILIIMLLFRKIDFYKSNKPTSLFTLDPKIYEKPSNAVRIPGIKTYYINLENRRDRMMQIENELNKIGLDFFRVNAVKYDPGYIGCSMSHIKCLEKAIGENAKHIMIVEDDFKFIIDRTEFEDIIKYLLNIDYDVFILSYNTYDENIKKENGSRFYKIKNTQTASGYIVNSRYYEKLLKNFKEGVDLLKKTNIYEKYAIDQYWKILQTEDKWICAGKRIGIQRSSYSDIEKRDVNYNV